MKKYFVKDTLIFIIENNKNESILLVQYY